MTTPVKLTTKQRAVLVEAQNKSLVVRVGERNVTLRTLVVKGLVKLTSRPPFVGITVTPAGRLAITETTPLKELARRIDVHLKRFERDPKINVESKDRAKTHPYYFAGAYVRGRYVSVTYVTYQGGDRLLPEAALMYLAKLDKGFVGRHWEALRRTKFDKLGMR